ncbi:MAG TPA: MBL fold metallo-hydrolase [Candidatus Nanopelagicales bacterium]|nr:MBL fold metallo-hydrolase [Candidatus Nanopelagicales bacterium]
MILTHIGGPTLLVEVDGWRLLTDPTFDPAGGHYAFGWGTSSDKVTGPALAAADLPPVDAVLLSHDHHGDNLDTAGRQLLTDVPTVLTTVAGARRLNASNVRGLAAGDTAPLTAPDKPDLEVTATPARHGPPLTRPIVGQVVGFAIRRSGESQVLVWVTGDTVLYGGLREAAKDLDVDVLVVHVGGVQFPITGPLRYTMIGREAVELVDLTAPRVAVPVHYEGWSHFKDGRTGIDRALAAASEDTRSRVRQLSLGSPTDLS